MSDQIIKVLEYLGEKFGIAIDWTTENIMPYAEELFKRFVTMKIIYTSIGIFTGLVATVIAIVLFIKIIKGFLWIKEHEECIALWDIYQSGTIEPSGLGILTIFVVLFCTITAIIALCINVPNLIEWIIVPEVQFVKEIAALLGTTV